MPKKIIRNLQFGVGLSLLILIASSVASYWSIQNQMNHRESVGKSRRAVTAVKDVLVALLDAETGNRGYQLTGRESFLEPYNRSLAEYSKTFEYVKNLDISDPHQQRLLDLLEKNVEANLSNMKLFVQNRRKGQMMTQQQIAESKAYMDKCRQIVKDFSQYEESQLAVKTQGLNRSSIPRYCSFFFQPSQQWL